jgi:hypothetical protein
MNMNTIILGIKIIVMFTNQFEIIPMGLHVLHVICVIDSIMRMADRLPGARHRVLPQNGFPFIVLGIQNGKIVRKRLSRTEF